VLCRQHPDVIPCGRVPGVGDGDVLLGEIDGCPFYIDAGLDAAWLHDSFILDVGPGGPEGFSLPAGVDLHFVATRAAPTCPPPPTPARGTGERRP
jgi:uncharacterized protein (DUF779 family)